MRLYYIPNREAEPVWIVSVHSYTVSLCCAQRGPPLYLSGERVSILRIHYCSRVEPPFLAPPPDSSNPLEAFICKSSTKMSDGGPSKLLVDSLPLLPPAWRTIDLQARSFPLKRQFRHDLCLRIRHSSTLGSLRISSPLLGPLDPHRCFSEFGIHKERYTYKGTFKRESPFRGPSL